MNVKNEMIKASELDVVYISYDEPDCEYNWADLLVKCPWAKRVHGVTGLDKAHQAAGQLGKTDFIVTVDGDNIVDSIFFERSFDLKENQIYSFNSKNNINGLIYGNGGLKIWPKHWLENMFIHENNKVDFCWEENYNQLSEVYSETILNGSPFQAFRVGMREGVKLGLHHNTRIEVLRDFSDLIYSWNKRALTIWCTIGSDIKNGEWAIYGARLGCYMLYFKEDWDWTDINDYEWFERFWEIALREYPKSLELGIYLKELGLDIAEIDADQSKFFKSILPKLKR